LIRDLLLIKRNSLPEQAINALLTAMDRLRHHPNYLVFATSNLVKALDSAFMDRIDFKYHVPNPPEKVRYEILRHRYDKIVASHLLELDTEKELFPQWSIMNLNRNPGRDQPSSKLGDIARNAEGLSGRALSRLPWLSLVQHTSGGSPTIEDLLSALEIAVEAEKTVKGIT